MSCNNTIAVVIPSHDRPAMLVRALESVMSNTRKPDQLIVVNDSKSSISAVVMGKLSSFSKMGVDVKVISSGGVGAQRARNLGLSACKSKYVLFLDDDDEMTSERLRRFEEAWCDNVSLLYSDDFYANNGKVKKKTRRPVQVGLNDILLDNLIGNQVYTIADRLRAVGGYDETLSAAQDYDLWIRMIMKYGPAAKVADAEQVVYIGHASITLSNARVQGYLCVFKKYRKHMSTAARIWKIVQLRHIKGKPIRCKHMVMIALDAKSKRVRRRAIVYYLCQLEWFALLARKYFPWIR